MSRDPVLLKPRLKVCCIASVQEAELAVRLGASAIGLVSTMPSGPGVISDSLIAEIAASVTPTVRTFLLTSSQDPDAIVAQHRRCRVSTLQLCDRLTRESLVRLRGALPDVSLVQVIHVLDSGAIDEAVEVAPHVDGLLLDSGNPRAAVKTLGGTGRVHDWAVSRRVCEAVSTPVYLAGGLTPENVGDAVAAVRPYGVDVCTGLRSNGRLNESKLRRFTDNLRARSL